MDTIPPLSAPILLDGATGTGLPRGGRPQGRCAAQGGVGHPQALCGRPVRPAGFFGFIISQF